MARRVKKPAAEVVGSLPPLPLNAGHWEAIFKAMRLPPQHRRVVDLALRGYETKQIAILMGIGEATIKTYLQRIFDRTGTRGRMQLAMHVLALSHQVNGNGTCRPSG
ncbi:MAG TPA: helix-turn-helix transcriptional regulator [Pirellulales bacterium]|jgi:DNA-binding NarL/FixJ family response regulator|nr:helix-turn-helix transcriptional regulator [Pirellulales bacterium]